MRIVHLKVENFRSIRLLDWRLDSSLVCLIGAGDAGKSTVLLAIEKALSSRWNETFTDSDFHEGVTSDPILIEVSIGDLPPALLREDAFGLWLRDLDVADQGHDEPLDPSKAVVTIRLTVDHSLEPHWYVVNDREPEGHRLNAQERRRFGMMRIDDSSPRHLSWGRGSALAALTGEESEVAATLSGAVRAARASIDREGLSKLTEASRKAQAAFSNVGVNPRAGLGPHLDPSSSAGTLSLHEGEVPFSNAGTGTIRLSVLALQLERSSGVGITLIDEVEHGLDPHRLRRLLRVLKEASAKSMVVLTTHSPTVIQDLGIGHVRLLRDGPTHEIAVPDEKVSMLFRGYPEALLSRRVIIGEGETEYGFVLGLDDIWGQKHPSLAFKGTSVAAAGGCGSVGVRSSALRRLGFEVAILADEDAPLDIPPAELRNQGVATFVWNKGRALEQVLFEELDSTGVCGLLTLAVELHGEDRIVRTAKSKKADLKAQFDLADPVLRKRLGSAAKASGWYKDPYSARRLGAVVAHHWETSTEYLKSELTNFWAWCQR